MKEQHEDDQVSVAPSLAFAARTRAKENVTESRQARVVEPQYVEQARAQSFDWDEAVIAPHSNKEENKLAAGGQLPVYRTPPIYSMRQDDENGTSADVINTLHSDRPEENHNGPQAYAAKGEEESQMYSSAQLSPRTQQNVRSQLSSIRLSGQRMATPRMQHEQAPPPRAQTFEDLVTREHSNLDKGVPEQRAEPSHDRENYARFASANVPGAFQNAVTSHVASLRIAKRRVKDEHAMRDDDEDSLRQGLSGDSRQFKARKSPNYKRRSKRKHARQTDDSSASSSSSSDSDSDTDAYNESSAGLKAYASDDPDRPLESDEEEYFYTMPEADFRRWRARKDERRKKLKEKRKRKRKKEKRKVELRAKSAYIAQLSKMKMQGVPVSREYTMEDDLEDMRLEFERHQACIAMIEKVETMRKYMGLGLAAAEFVLCLIGVRVEGWAAEVTRELQEKKYDSVLEKIYQKYWRRSAPSPEFSLVIMILGMLAFKWLENRERRAREATGANGVGNGGGGGMGGALAGVARAMIGSFLGRGGSGDGGGGGGMSGILGSLGSMMSGMQSSSTQSSSGAASETTSQSVPAGTRSESTSATSPSRRRRGLAGNASSSQRQSDEPVNMETHSGKQAKEEPEEADENWYGAAAGRGETKPQSPTGVELTARQRAAMAAEARRKVALETARLKEQSVANVDDDQAAAAYERAKAIRGD